MLTFLVKTALDKDRIFQLFVQNCIVFSSQNLYILQ